MFKPMLTDDEVLEAIRSVKSKWTSKPARLEKLRLLKEVTAKYHPEGECAGVLSDVRLCIEELEEQ